MAKTANAMVNRISFDDERQCSSRVITASLQLVYGVDVDVCVVREMLPPEYQKGFDEFWEKAEEAGFDMVGKEVFYQHHDDHFYSFDTIELV